ncbi:MAG: hypothetical protein ACRDHK_05605 [Actinomycetota bacterium]
MTMDEYLVSRMVGTTMVLLIGGGLHILNEMDGMADDADVAFVLSTNRADALELALAARPGRVDLAVQIPLPDEEARRGLLELYGRGLEFRLTTVD